MVKEYCTLGFIGFSQAITKNYNIAFYCGNFSGKNGVERTSRCCLYHLSSSEDRIEMPPRDDQVPNKQQLISSSTSANTTHATSPSTDTSSRDTNPPFPAEAPAAGRKRALLCGVTYKNSENPLQGSVNDVKEIRVMLINQFGYPDDDESIRVLIEDNQKINVKKTIPPTKKNVEDSLKWLVEGSKSGDKLVFFFSGHCCRPDQTHDHVCLVCTEGGLISNYDINSTIVRPLKEGVTLYAIVDACFSGSILDLKYKYDQQSKVWEDNDKPPPKAEKGIIIKKKKAEKGTSGGLAICLSATDNQETAESNANSGKILGAMTYNLTKMVKRHLAKNPNVTYEDILKKMQELHDESCRPKKVSRSDTRRVYAEGKKIEVPVLSSSDRELKVSSLKFLL